MLLDDKQIKTLLAGDVKALVNIEILESINSTNEYLKNISVKDGIPFCLAEQQTQGKGRLGRSWHSPFAQNIYLSCRYQFHKNINQLAGLSLVIGLAVSKALVEQQLKEKLAIKWPNDIYWADKKLAGILVETSALSANACSVIIGVGLNVNMLVDDDIVTQPWTSLQQIVGKPVDRNIIAAALINNIIYYLQQFELYNFAHFIPEWNAQDYLLGNTITMLTSDQEISGIAAGVNAEGNLLLKLADGSVQTFSSGEASVKKCSSIL